VRFRFLLRCGIPAGEKSCHSFSDVHFLRLIDVERPCRLRYLCDRSLMQRWKPGARSLAQVRNCERRVAPVTSRGDNRQFQNGKYLPSLEQNAPLPSRPSRNNSPRPTICSACPVPELRAWPKGTLKPWYGEVTGSNIGVIHACDHKLIIPLSGKRCNYFQILL
jgi:hypothetical protein